MNWFLVSCRNEIENWSRNATKLETMELVNKKFKSSALNQNSFSLTSVESQIIENRQGKQPTSERDFD
jgi:hypothetical protein